MKRLTVLLLVLVGIACGGGGGGGGSPTAPAMSVPQISGIWSGTATFAGVEGAGCIARLFRSIKGLPVSASWNITQSGSSITVDFTFDGEVIGRLAGTIESSGQFRVEADVTGEPEPLECEGDLYEVDELVQVITGVASGSTIEANWRSPARIFLDGELQGEITILLDIALSR